MKGLMELLASSDKGEGDAKTKDLGADLDSDAPDISATGFTESASQAMDALKAGDQEAFSDALKACIEMVR